MARELNRRLSISDASFLYVEKPNAPMHVGSCLIYDGHVSADALARVLRERIHLMPRYRQKVVFPPFALAHPTWEDDPDFDVSRHVREVTLPAPGDDRILSEIGGHAYAPPLDPTARCGGHRPSGPRRRQHRRGLEDPSRDGGRRLDGGPDDGPARPQARRTAAAATQPALASAADPRPRHPDAGGRARPVDRGRRAVDRAGLPLDAAAGPRTLGAAHDAARAGPPAMRPPPRVPFNAPLSTRRRSRGRSSPSRRSGRSGSTGRHDQRRGGWRWWPGPSAAIFALAVSRPRGDPVGSPGEPAPT